MKWKSISCFNLNNNKNEKANVRRRVRVGQKLCLLNTEEANERSCACIRLLSSLTSQYAHTPRPSSFLPMYICYLKISKKN